VPNEDKPDLSLFLDILRTLERIGAPYMIIGGFAATMYGSTRTTYDIDIVVDLKEQHIQALVAAYPSPRYYADPEQMRDSIRRGISFNIIDGKRGEKADLSPLTRDSRYRRAFSRRIRQRITWPGVEPFDVWCARPDDVIYGKLLAWEEGRSHKHESDIYDMLVFRYLEADPALAATFDEAHLDAQAQALGPEVVEFWESVKEAARREVGRDEPPAAP
jgi:uncharacterized protein (DUF1330 family)